MFTKLHSVDSTSDAPLYESEAVNAVFINGITKFARCPDSGRFLLKHAFKSSVELLRLRLRDGAENRSYLLAPRCHRRRSEQSKSGETRRCSSCGCFSPLSTRRSNHFIPIRSSGARRGAEPVRPAQFSLSGVSETRTETGHS